MRYSSIGYDAGYGNYMELRYNHKDLRIFLDGKEYTRCVTADDEAGYIVFYPESAFKTPHPENGFQTETKYGKVTFEIYESRKA